MTVIILIALGIVIALVIGLYRYLRGRFGNLADRLTVLEGALGVEDWVNFLRIVPDTDPEGPQRRSFASRLDRIEARLGEPMARARLDVRQRMRELDEELMDDPSSGYEHSQVANIQDLVERGERPDRKEWESWVHTPFPWTEH
jgi:hypothetical protein